MKKIRLPSFHWKKQRHTVRFSIALKSSVVYTLLFGTVIAAIIGAMAWALANQASHHSRLEQFSFFISDCMSGRRRGMEHFDYGSFAQANNIYIEISGPGNDKIVSYGSPPARGQRHYEIRHPIVSKPGRPLSLTVVDRESMGLAGNLTMSGFFIILGLLLLLAAVLGALFVRKMMRPVYSMMQTARSISANDLSQRIETVPSHDEFDELAETFNGMLDRIQASYEQQKRFVSDASHELRTPLSVISGYANLLRRWGGEDKAVRDESIAKIIVETSNMQKLIERLLFLAKADQQTQPIHPALFCISDMMKETAGETRLIDKSHAILEKIEPGAMLTADPSLIRQAVRAVVENSRKYTPAGGIICLSCHTAQGCVIIEVSDSGIGIGEKDLPHIFDRFYKADEARTRGSKGSSGLGLSIVKWIVERHGGTVMVRSAPKHGTSVKMIFSKKSFLPDGSTH